MLMLFYLKIMELDEKDVVYLTAHSTATPYMESRTFRIFDFVQAMRARVGVPSHWVQGIDCELLKAGAPGWKKGRVRIRIEVEFIPDEPEVAASEANELDALRSKLDL